MPGLSRLSIPVYYMLSDIACPITSAQNRKWTGRYFQPAWLWDVGLEIHLGHGGNQCPNYDDINPFEVGDDVTINPGPSHTANMDSCLHQQSHAISTICIVDRSGIHELPVRWCRCPTRLLDDRQLLAIGMFPSTFKVVKTAFTFQVLDNFIFDNLEYKTSAFNFYNKLRRITSNTFPKLVKDQYQELIRVSHQ